MQKRSIILLVLIVMTQAISAMGDRYQSFWRWCGALTCKQIRREEVTYPARTFLGLNKTQQPLPRKPFSRTTPSMFGYGNDGVVTEFNLNTNAYEHRMANRWRALSDDRESKQTYDDNEIGSRVHYDQLLMRSDSSYDDKKYIIYSNSIPVNEYNFLCGGTCADSTGNLWITCKPDICAIHTENNKIFPLQLLWVEKFQKQRLVHEELLPAQHYSKINESMAIQYIENDAAFQLYYDTADIKTKVTPIESKFKIELHEDMPEPPCCMVTTYALNRVCNCAHRIDASMIKKWHDAFINFKKGTLIDADFNAIKTEMRAVVDGFES